MTGVKQRDLFGAADLWVCNAAEVCKNARDCVAAKPHPRPHLTPMKCHDYLPYVPGGIRVCDIPVRGDE